MCVYMVYEIIHVWHWMHVQIFITTKCIQLSAVNVKHLSLVPAKSYSLDITPHCCPHVILLLMCLDNQYSTRHFIPHAVLAAPLVPLYSIQHCFPCLI